MRYTEDSFLKQVYDKVKKKGRNPSDIETWMSFAERKSAGGTYAYYQ